MHSIGIIILVIITVFLVIGIWRLVGSLEERCANDPYVLVECDVLVKGGGILHKEPFKLKLIIIIIINNVHI